MSSFSTNLQNSLSCLPRPSGKKAKKIDACPAATVIPVETSLCTNYIIDQFGRLTPDLCFIQRERQQPCLLPLHRSSLHLNLYAERSGEGLTDLHTQEILLVIDQTVRLTFGTSSTKETGRNCTKSVQVTLSCRVMTSER